MFSLNYPEKASTPTRLSSSSGSYERERTKGVGGGEWGTENPVRASLNIYEHGRRTLKTPAARAIIIMEYAKSFDDKKRERESRADGRVDDKEGNEGGIKVR